jgi:preprotein translocase subunit SecG
MYQIILLVHVLIAAFIVLLVLIQQGKGATMGASFGSGASQTVFGSRGSGSLLFRVTMICIAMFFVTSISLNYMATKAYKSEKVITLPQAPMKQQVPVKQESAPVVPDLTKGSGTQPLPMDPIPVKK